MKRLKRAFPFRLLAGRNLLQAPIYPKERYQCNHADQGLTEQTDAEEHVGGPDEQRQAGRRARSRYPQIMWALANAPAMVEPVCRRCWWHRLRRRSPGMLRSRASRSLIDRGHVRHRLGDAPAKRRRSSVPPKTQAATIVPRYESTGSNRWIFDLGRF